MATVDVSLAVVLSNAKADVAKHKSASNTIWASFCMDLPSRLKSAEKSKKVQTTFCFLIYAPKLLTRQCIDAAHFPFLVANPHFCLP